LAKIYLIIYGLLLLSGAYFGKKAGSNVSMIMGLVSGLLTFGLIFIHAQSPAVGRWGLIIISAGLAIVFLKRYMVTMKVMPSGMLLCASVLAIVAAWFLNR